MKIPLSALPVVLSVLSMAASASAANVGTDNTTASAYADGWQTGDNGAVSGSAFGAWTLIQGGNSGTFLGNSTNTGGSTSINTGGSSFGMYGVNQEADAFRDFSSALNVGQTFSADLKVNYRNGYKGLDLRNGSGGTILNFNVGGDDYTVTTNFSPSNTISIGNSYSDDTVFHLAFTQTSSTGGTYSIMRSGGVTDLDTGTYAGIASGFKLYVNAQDTTPGSNDLYSNDFAIVPEPATFLTCVLMLAMGGLQFLRSRRLLA